MSSLSFDRKKLLNIFLLALAFLSLVWPAIWNGFPFIFTDSLSYLTSGVELLAPVDRPIFYGLFIRISLLFTEIWGLVFFQAAIVIYLLQRLVNALLPDLPQKNDLLWIILVGLCTSAPWFVGQVSADIFTSCLFLAMIILLLTCKQATSGSIAFLGGVIVLAICMHSGNLIIGALLLLYMVGLLLLQKEPWSYIKKYTLIVSSCLLIGFISIVSSNIIFHQGLTFNRWGNVILLARILEDGAGLKYLNAVCESSNLKTCAALPLFNEAAQKEIELGITSNPELKNMVLNALLWDGGINKIGGLSEVNSEASSIIWGTFLTYPKEVFHAFLINSIDQLKTFSVGNQFGSTAHIVEINNYIESQFPNSYQSYVKSSQYQNTIKPVIILINPIYSLFIYFSLIFLLVALYISWQYKSRWESVFRGAPIQLVTYSVFGFLFFNAIVTGGLSAVFDRYQSRVIWLLPAITILIIFGMMRRRATF